MTVYTDNTNGGVDIDLNPDDAKTKWLLEQGYLGVKKPTKGQEDRGRTATSVPASQDPTLAINREDPVPVDKIKAHVANEGVDQNEGAETVHGSNMGLEADQVGAPGPAVKVTTHKDAGKEPVGDEGSSLKSAIEKEQGQPPLPGKGKAPVEDAGSSLKEAIDKEQPATTAGRPA